MDAFMGELCTYYGIGLDLQRWKPDVLVPDSNVLEKTENAWVQSGRGSGTCIVSGTQVSPQTVRC